jgi:hypothetical protein
MLPSQRYELALTDHDMTPTLTPTLTPRPSFANFHFSGQFSVTAGAYGLAHCQAVDQAFSHITVAPTADLPFQNGQPCDGQWVEWYPGSIWNTYAYQQHKHKAIPWTLIRIKDGRVRLQSKACAKYLEAEGDPETGETVCQSCRALLVLLKLKRFVERATTNALPRTPWKYLNFLQTRELLVGLAKRVKQYEVQVWIMIFFTWNLNNIISVKTPETNYTKIDEEGQQL